MTDAPVGAPAAGRLDLLEAADRAIEAYGPNAPMARIAAEAGITKPVLYRHFGSKSGLYQAVAERYTHPLLTQVRRAVAEPGEPVERARAAIDAYFRFIEAHPERYRFLMHRALGEDPATRSVVNAFSRRVGEQVAHALYEAVGEDPALAEATAAWGQAIVGLVQSAADWWLEQRTVPRRRMVDHLTALLWSGLGGVTQP